uniref:Uncharacterized protein n=1 Tax=viral metagenome TaxID=1070528 RepID=A0A6C0JI09_9ZZZZ
MKKLDVFCWVVIGLLLVFLWHSSSVEFFQDTSGIKGPPYTASDATKIVTAMPSTMKAALKTSTGSDDPVRLIQPITDIMSDFHAVYAAATVPLTSANVDTFLQTRAIPSGLTKADVNTLLVAYFVTPTPGSANAPLTAAQVTANAQAVIRAAATAANQSTYAGMYMDASGSDVSGNTAAGSDVSGNTAAGSDVSGTRLLLSGLSGGGFGTPSSNATTPYSGMQVGGPRYGGQGSYTSATTSGNWSSVGSNYPTMYGPKSNNTTLPDSNGMILPTAQQVGADGNTVYMPGCRAPGQLGAFTPMKPEKTDGDPLGFLPDYRVFMK